MEQTEMERQITGSSPAAGERETIVQRIERPREDVQKIDGPREDMGMYYKPVETPQEALQKLIDNMRGDIIRRRIAECFTLPPQYNGYGKRWVPAPSDIYHDVPKIAFRMIRRADRARAKREKIERSVDWQKDVLYYWG